MADPPRRRRRRRGRVGFAARRRDAQGLRPAVRPAPAEPASVEAALGCPGVACVVVVAPPGHVSEAERVTDGYADGAGSGGPRRRRAPRLGGGRAGRPPDDVDVVLVHDAARALTPSALFADVAAAVAAGAPAVVPGLPLVDTVKQVDESGTVVATPPRASLRAMQTPQGFRRDVLRARTRRGRRALGDRRRRPGRALGLPVLVVHGDPRAHKMTTPDDLDRVVALRDSGGPRDD